MSFSVTAYPFPWGRGVLLQESIPTLSEGRAGYSLDNSLAYRRALTDEKCGVQYLAQGHFDMQLSLAPPLRSLVDLLYPLSYSRPCLGVCGI